MNQQLISKDLPFCTKLAYASGPIMRSSFYLNCRVGRGLSPPIILNYWSFYGDTSVVILIALCFGADRFCCFAPYIRFHVFLV